MSKGRIIHQFSLFGYVPPKIKVPLSAARIREVKALIEKGDGKAAAEVLRGIREGLERFERGLYNRKPETEK